MDSLAEEWREIEGFPGYRVSNHGRVESTRTGSPKIMVPVAIGGRHRHLTVKLSRGARGTEQKWQIHRLVMRAFAGESELQVNHIDGNPTNNRLENLEYVTCRENVLHARRTGLHTWRPTGSKHGRSKITEQDVTAILESLATETAASIARRYGLTKGSVLRIKSGHGWSHVARTA